MTSSHMTNLLSRAMASAITVAVGMAILLVLGAAVGFRQPAGLIGLLLVAVFTAVVGGQFRKLTLSDVELRGYELKVLRGHRTTPIVRSDIVWAATTEETTTPLLHVWYGSGETLQLLVSHFGKRHVAPLEAFTQSVQERTVRAVRAGQPLALTSRMEQLRSRAVAGTVSVLSAGATVGASVALGIDEDRSLLVGALVIGIVLALVSGLKALRTTNGRIEGGVLRIGRAGCVGARVAHVGWGHLVVWREGHIVPWLVPTPGGKLAHAVVECCRTPEVDERGPGGG